MSLGLSRNRPFSSWIQEKGFNSITPRGISRSSQPKESLTKMINGLFMGFSGDLDPFISGQAFY